MIVSYKKLWKRLIDLGLNKTSLQKLAGISSVSVAKLGKGENVTTDVLLKICSALHCDFADIMEMEEEPEWKCSYTPSFSFADEAQSQISQGQPFFELGELFCGPGGLAVGATLANIGSAGCRIKHKWCFAAKTTEFF